MACTRRRQAGAVAFEQQVQRVFHLPLVATAAGVLSKGRGVVVDAKIVVAHPKGGNAPAVAAGDVRLVQVRAPPLVQLFLDPEPVVVGSSSPMECVYVAGVAEVGPDAVVLAVQRAGHRGGRDVGLGGQRLRDRLRSTIVRRLHADQKGRKLRRSVARLLPLQPQVDVGHEDVGHEVCRRARRVHHMVPEATDGGSPA